jgi:hypothetical protein
LCESGRLGVVNFGADRRVHRRDRANDDLVDTVDILDIERERLRDEKNIRRLISNRLSHRGEHFGHGLVGLMLTSAHHRIPLGNRGARRA